MQLREIEIATAHRSIRFESPRQLRSLICRVQAIEMALNEIVHVHERAWLSF